MASQIFPHTCIILVLTNYAQLLLYISHEQSDLYLLVTTKALLVATTKAQVNMQQVIVLSLPICCQPTVCVF